MFRYYTKLIPVFFFIPLIFSCNEPDLIGLGVQPPSDKLNVKFSDTATISAYSMIEDSIRSDETTYNLLGSYNDPVFGKTYASTYTQLQLSSNNVNFGNNPVLDSIVLCLQYKNYYGDIKQSQTLKVYEITESIYKDSSYYSTRKISIGDKIGEITYIPNQEDSVVVNGINSAPHLRIKLYNSFGQKILAASGTSYLSDNTNFLNFIKGIYLTSKPESEPLDPDNTAIIYYNLLSSSSVSGIIFYYQNSDEDSLEYRFDINEGCARFNNFEHYNYDNADISLKQQMAGDTLKGDSILYVQSMAGVKVKIKFPFIENFSQPNKIAVNMAELVLKVDNNDLNIDKYNPPLRLTLVRIDENGLSNTIPDFPDPLNPTNSEIEYFGGFYDTSSKEYKFRISYYIQDLINGTLKDYGLYLIVYGSAGQANRVILNGSKRSINNMKLQLTYTEIK